MANFWRGNSGKKTFLFISLKLTLKKDFFRSVFGEPAWADLVKEDEAESDDEFFRVFIIAFV